MISASLQKIVEVRKGWSLDTEKRGTPRSEAGNRRWLKTRSLRLFSRGFLLFLEIDSIEYNPQMDATDWITVYSNPPPHFGDKLKQFFALDPKYVNLNHGSYI